MLISTQQTDPKAMYSTSTKQIQRFTLWMFPYVAGKQALVATSAKDNRTSAVSLQLYDVTSLLLKINQAAHYKHVTKNTHGTAL